MHFMWIITCLFLHVKGFYILLLSERLKECRKKKNLTQPQVACDTGISIRAYKYYESGEQAPSVKVLVTLADYFDVSIDYLVGRTDKPVMNKER